MKNKLKRLNILFLLLSLSSFAQVKISGVVIDSQNQSVPFANIVFTGSTVGTVSDENGKFYLESDKTYTVIEVSFLGFETAKYLVKNRDFNLKIVLNEAAAQLGEVFIYAGKVKKKGNPAIAILEKIWAKKRENGIYLFDQYQYEKYEKLEFDMNNVDSAFMKKKLALWTLTLVVLSVSLSACCCGGGKETVEVVVTPGESQGATGKSAAPVSGVTAGQELQDLKAAHDQGAITDEEFERAKKKILTRE